jgi:hypothetical protein
MKCLLGRIADPCTNQKERNPMLDYGRSTRRELCALLAAPVLLAGCVATPDEDPPPPPPPPSALDGGSAPMDAGPCGGDGCIDPPGTFSLPEGGEFRLERFQDSADDSAPTLAAQAFFFKGQMPATRSVGEQMKLRDEIVGKGYACLDRRNGNYFDSGKTAEAQEIVDSRAYYDIGATATLTSTDTPAEVITLEKLVRAEDPEGAIDLSSGLEHPVLYKGDAARRIRRNTTYRPSIAGSADYPTLDLKWGETAVSEPLADPYGNGTPQIYMPSAFVMTSPTEEEFFTPGFLTFTRGQDRTLTYSAEAKPAGWPIVLPYAAFLDEEGRVQAFCIKLRGASSLDADDGELIVPYEVLEILEPNGRLVFGRMVHAVWEYAVDSSRIDMLGMESKRSPPYTIQNALPELR